MRVERDHEQSIAENSEAAIDGSGSAVGEIGRQFATVCQKRPARPGIERPGEIVGPGHVQHAVRCDVASLRNRGLASSCRSAASIQARDDDVRWRDLRERTVAACRVVAGICEPARRILQAIENVAIRDTRGSLARAVWRAGPWTRLFANDLLDVRLEISLKAAARVQQLNRKGVFVPAFAADPLAVAGDDGDDLRTLGRRVAGRRRAAGPASSGTR